MHFIFFLSSWLIVNNKLISIEIPQVINATIINVIHELICIICFIPKDIKVEITITSSSKNIEKIKENSQNYYEKLNKNADEYYVYQEEIYSLQEELTASENENASLREKLTELESKLDNINNVMEN